MFAACLGLLFVAAALASAALASTASELQPSAHRVVIAAVAALIAPLFWPGTAATPRATAVRIVLWSSTVAVLAAVATFATGGALQSLAKGAMVCLVLTLLLVVAHAVTAWLEGPLAARTGDARIAREVAGRSVVIMLATLGSLPLWFGPAAEMLAGGAPWLIDAVIGVSPLTHLAVASGNDLLRNQWLYQHSNLAALQYDYPRIASFTAFYVAIGLALLLVPLGLRRRGGPADGALPPQSNTEHAK